MAVNRLAYFLAGAVLGAAGLAMVKSGKGQQLISGVIHGGSGLAENVLARVETVKEDIEDSLAEMKYKAEQAKEAAGAAESEESGTENVAEAEDIVMESEVEPAPEAKEESIVDSSESKGE